ncbi:hypothetical protein [Spirosoma sp. 209]|uniref:hypothetical protein n=1 Tax=Spirosoma sp. 209 TaxID=1955701 RepID=UPI00098D50C7|nr:hypothetical protein [Spirosoma sp. 209]
MKPTALLLCLLLAAPATAQDTCYVAPPSWHGHDSLSVYERREHERLVVRNAELQEQNERLQSGTGRFVFLALLIAVAAVAKSMVK